MYYARGCELQRWALATTATPVTEIALASGFADLSNFIRSFRAEFAVAPSSYRARS